MSGLLAAIASVGELAVPNKAGNLSLRLTDYKESPGPQTACSGPGENISSGPQATADRLEMFTLSRKDWLSFAE